MNANGDRATLLIAGGVIEIQNRVFINARASMK
jgi:hypothetical protein